LTTFNQNCLGNYLLLLDRKKEIPLSRASTVGGITMAPDKPRSPSVGSHLTPNSAILSRGSWRWRTDFTGGQGLGCGRGIWGEQSGSLVAQLLRGSREIGVVCLFVSHSSLARALTPFELSLLPLTFNLICELSAPKVRPPCLLHPTTTGYWFSRFA